MTWIEWVALPITACMAAYLFAALIFPEKIA